jgi:hypothetical protein
MTLSQRISDPEIEANASEIATGVLQHPLVQRLDWQIVRPVMAFYAGVRGICPVHALRPALVAIDAAEITLGLEMR